jgi:hypothetical protein
MVLARYDGGGVRGEFISSQQSEEKAGVIQECATMIQAATLILLFFRIRV